MQPRGHQNSSNAVKSAPKTARVRVIPAGTTLLGNNAY